MSRIRVSILLQLILVASLAFGSLATLASFASAPPAIAKEGKGHGGKDGKSDKGKGHRNDERGGKKDKKDKQSKSDRGKDKKVDAEAVVLYTIEVSCDAADGGTACRFSPRAPAGAHEVNHFVVPAEAVCAPVIGGDGRLLEPDPVTGVAGYTSSGSETALNLVLDDVASPAGQAIYWVKVTGAVVPASGPALQCAQFQLQAEMTPVAQPTTAIPMREPATPAPDEATPEPTTELTDSTGSIVVEVYDCPIATPEADYDWFSECVSAGENNRFRLVPEGDEPPTVTQGVTDAGGQARFSQVEPGVYVLTQLGRDWCHAKSDGVDEQGNVVVTAGERTTVWVFSCQDPTASPSPVS